MKINHRYYVIGLVWLMCTTLATAQDDKERAAIKSVIEQETTAYLNKNSKAWIDCWVHAPYSHWSYSDSTGYTSYSGWKAIEIGFTDYFLTSTPSTARVERKWGEIRVYGSGAYARFVQITTEDGKTREEDELRILEKQNNKWKIVLVGVMPGTKSK